MLNPQIVSIILVAMSITLILLALFSKKIKKINDAMEKNRIINNPKYAKLRDVSTYYCPKCKQGLSNDSIKIMLKNKSDIQCANCHTYLRFNHIPGALYLISNLVFLAIIIFGKKYFNYFWVNMPVLLICLVLMITSHRAEKLKEVKEYEN